MEDKDFLVSVGKKIKNQRKILDYNQDELGFHRTQIARYERGEIAMSIINLRDICTRLQVSADYLLGLPNNMNGLTEEQEVNLHMMKKLDKRQNLLLTGMILALLEQNKSKVN